MAWLMSTRVPSGADLQPRRQRPGCASDGSADAMLFKSAMRSRCIADSVRMAWSRSSQEPRCSPASCGLPNSSSRASAGHCRSHAVHVRCAQPPRRPRQHPRDVVEVVAKAILFRVHRAAPAREPSRSTWNTRPPRLEHAASSWRRDLCPPSCRTTVFHVERAPVHGTSSLLRRERFRAPPNAPRPRSSAFGPSPKRRTCPGSGLTWNARPRAGAAPPAPSALRLRAPPHGVSAKRHMAWTSRRVALAPGVGVAGAVRVCSCSTWNEPSLTRVTAPPHPIRPFASTANARESRSSPRADRRRTALPDLRGGDAPDCLVVRDQRGDELPHSHLVCVHRPDAEPPGRSGLGRRAPPGRASLGAGHLPPRPSRASRGCAARTAPTAGTQLSPCR